MALFPKSLCLFLTLFIAILSSSYSFTLEVGGSRGWILNPTQTYSAWSHRLRFNVNDTLHFKYNPATDSVLVVSKDDYDNCNSSNPIKKLEGNGDSSFTFDQSGPIFFITRNKSNCDQGQKIGIVVLAIRNKQKPPSANSPAPVPEAAAISPAPGAANPADASAPAAYAPAARSSARATFNGDSTVPFVIMMISLAFVWVVC